MILVKSMFSKCTEKKCRATEKHPSGRKQPRKFEYSEILPLSDQQPARKMRKLAESKFSEMFEDSNNES